jgi:DNA (cytosine-5)-methyltransferase 1
MSVAMNTLHLCSGRGGSLWTGAILGWNNRWALDVDPWRIECIAREAAAGWWPGLRTVVSSLPDTKWYASIHDRVDCIAAGFSCKDISAAGTGEGIEHGKSSGPTWRGVRDAVEHFRPTWVFLENSPRIRGKGRAIVTSSLVALGYRWRDGTLTASTVGAPHQRDRWFLLANRADTAGCGLPDNCVQHQSGSEDPQAVRSTPPLTADALCDRLQVAVQRGGLPETSAKEIEALARYCEAYHWNAFEPSLLRVVDGLADRSKRVESLGDAWVPLQAAAAWAALGGPHAVA